MLFFWRPAAVWAVAVTQFVAAGAFHHQVLASMAAVSLGWTTAFALPGLIVLRLRMPRPAAWRSGPADRSIA